MTLASKEHLELSTNDSSSSLMSCSRDIGGQTAADMAHMYGIEVPIDRMEARYHTVGYISNHVSGCRAYYDQSGIGRQYP